MVVFRRKNFSMPFSKVGSRTKKVLKAFPTLRLSVATFAYACIARAIPVNMNTCLLQMVPLTVYLCKLGADNTFPLLVNLKFLFFLLQTNKQSSEHQPRKFNVAPNERTRGPCIQTHGHPPIGGSGWRERERERFMPCLHGLVIDRSGNAALFSNIEITG